MECFCVNSQEIEGRLDCHFYRPEYTILDKKIKQISTKKLQDYIVSISSGATPDIKKSEMYYSNNNEGITFMRVQNVTPQGLDLEDVKFINKETHEGMLKRSQVNEFDLLVKITGVGRMAVSSVTPKDFTGNINQHLVVIKTKNEETSNILAAFLNSDIGEKLATKRATGGTRPALDYKALKSIPIVFKSEIVKVMGDAIFKSKQKESESLKLLDSINDYVLDELGLKFDKIVEDKI
jgi:restriction endonuclease S subunit